MVESYIKRFKLKNLEISKCPSSIAIEAFQKKVIKNFKLFVELTKITPRPLEVVYLEAQNL